ncbi:NAD-dependent epimerase/dehydratase family protein [Rhodopirellula sallentina]|uniref:CDP-tyvelose epimerase n=1 Tax=Rhodopirellula sallentina SM41 TaxID=1263870 RepID=M5TSW0_9BACT|nr:NAD-dependent epimerase/dehydratase family protein [Rhodopirellula sallentina]EMI52277.1 CDP-tyvelose epimerase [Rhodopirellula sallentina SM41]
MKILITGICGFVGSEIALHLRRGQSSDQLQIVGLDNLARNGSWRNRQRLAELDIDVQHGDIRARTDIEAIGKVDWIIDAAANPSVLAGVNGGSRKLLEDNLGGTINLLEHCREHGAGFVLLSTSRVYSIPPLAGLQVTAHDEAFVPDTSALPDGISAQGVTEAFSTAAPVSLYGSTKLTSEQLALEYSHTFDFPVWINRCGVMAGAGQFGKADQGIFAFWLHSWREGRNLKYIGFGGHGHQVRDCLHPRDLTDLLVKQLATECGDKARIINVSGGVSSSRSLKQLSNWCGEHWSPAEVASDHTPRPFDLPWVVLDHTLATETWGWTPETSTDQVLNEIADFAETESNWIEFSR